MSSTRNHVARAAATSVVAVVAITVLAIGSAVVPAFAAKKIKACTLVPQAQLETAVGNTFETPEDTTIGNFQGDCRFPSADTSGADLNLFLANDVKGGVKDAPLGLFFATKKSFEKVHGSATPVSGIGKQAYTSFDGSSSIPQGSLLVLDGKDHAALVVLTGSGITAESTVEKGKAVAALVLAKLK
jgi:hypothetical protein